MFTITKSKIQGKVLPETIAELAMEAKSNPEAFGRLYDHYVQPIYRYLLSRVETTHEAEDLTSQTFVAAYESLRSYRERGHFSAWLFRIARSKMMDHFRRDRLEVPLEAAEKVIGMTDPLAFVVGNEELSSLRFFIEKLTNDEQELIRLRYIAELSVSEIAELYGKREDTVRKSLGRLLARLKGQME